MSKIIAIICLIGAIAAICFFTSCNKKACYVCTQTTTITDAAAIEVQQLQQSQTICDMSKQGAKAYERANNKQWKETHSGTVLTYTLTTVCK